MSYKELVIGAGFKGNELTKVLYKKEYPKFENLTTLDINPEAKPDVLWDLNVRPLPFEDNTFDEIHAYDVLEHVGTQGDYKSFFEEFAEYWRILKPGGLFLATVPSGFRAAYSDPGHTRVFTEITPFFLSQEEYERQVGKTKMTDYRTIWKKHFDVVLIKRNDKDQNLSFILMKPEEFIK